MSRTWDIGDPEPDGVQGVRDHTHDCDQDNPEWHRTYDGEWKGYKDGGKVYLDWAELTRRWGPVTEVTP